MKIAVVCANGKEGQLITKEAISRGFDVTAVVRGENKSEARKAIIKYLFDLTNEDLRGFDAVVDAFGAWAPETLPQHSTSLKVLCDALSGTDTRLLVVGGTGSLYVNPEHTFSTLVTQKLFFLQKYRYYDVFGQKNRTVILYQNYGSYLVRVFLQDLPANTVAAGDFSCAEGAIS